MDGDGNLLDAPRNQQQALVGFAQQTTAHGLSRLAYGPTYKRALWLLIVIGASIGFVVHLQELIHRYYEYPVNTEFQSGRKQFEFPAVTICPTNFISSFNSYNNVTGNYSLPFYSNRGIYAMIYDIPRVWHVIKNVSHDFPTSPYSSYWDGRISLKQIAYRTLQFQKSFDTIVYCRYNSKRCSYRNFTEYKDPENFLCFSFVPENRTVVTAGEGQGLYLILYHYGTSFLTEEEEVDYVPGFMAVSHDPGTRPDFSQSFRIPLQKKVTAVVNVVSDEKVNRVPAPCVDSLPQVKYTVDWSQDTLENVTFKGTGTDCYINERQREFFNECNCLGDHIPIPANMFPLAKPCHHLHEKIFFHDIYKSTKNGVAYYVFRNDSNAKTDLVDFLYSSENRFNGSKERIHCFHRVNDRQTQEGVVASCPKQCTNNVYTTSAVYADWPRSKSKASKAIKYFLEDTIEKMAEDNLTSTIVPDLKKYASYTSRLYKVAVLDLYPASITSTVLKEDWAYLLRSLFSDLGGILGLWVGISIITITEFFELVIILGYLTLQKMHKGRVEPLITNKISITDDTKINNTINSDVNQYSNEKSNAVRNIYDELEIYNLDENQYKSAAPKTDNGNIDLARDVSLPPVGQSGNNSMEQYDVIQSKQSWFQKIFAI